MLLPAMIFAAQIQKPPAIAGARFEEEIRAFALADQAMPPKPGAVLFTGSSSIRLWSTLVEDFPRYRVINRGFGGSHIADAITYVDQIVTPYRPSAIVYFGGTNDLAEGTSATDVARNWETFVGLVRSRYPKVPIAYIAISPAPVRWSLLPKMTDANSRIRTVCARGKGLTFVDIVALMMDGDGGPRPDLFGPDQLHMNPKGYAIWTREVNAALATMLRRR